MATKSKKFNNFTVGFCSLVCIGAFLVAFISAIMLYQQDFLSYHITGEEITAIWFPEEYGVDLSQYAEMSSLRFEILISTILLVAGVILTIIFFILAMVYVGNKDETGKTEIKKIDKLPFEIQLVLIPTAVCAMVIAADYLASAVSKSLTDIYNIKYMAYYSYEPKLIEYFLGGVLALVCSIIIYWSCLSIVRKIKAGKLISTSLFGMLLFTPLKTLYCSCNIGIRLLIAGIILCVLSATVFLAPVVIVFLIVFISKWAKKYTEIETGLNEVSSGNLVYKIPVTGASELDKIAVKINSIAEASNHAMQNELKSQRMRTDLITNVSHDLKTPLTSMITYIDLLKTEGLEGEHAEEYLNILEQKTVRLKQLTEDLFEAAKASSGAMPIEISRVAVVSIINQALGELSEKIEASNKEFIVNAPEKEHYVWADGRQLWRVLENLIGNALKYAQDNSRVYIDVIDGYLEKDGIRKSAVQIVVKNVSKEQLNIDADTLLERFTRGDSSRSIEGSGLGLAISNDLMKLMKGTFRIIIDGDYFKAELVLPACEIEEQEGNEEYRNPEEEAEA